jgi:hypothetical protein
MAKRKPITKKMWAVIGRDGELKHTRLVPTRKRAAAWASDIFGTYIRVLVKEVPRK